MAQMADEQSYEAVISALGQFQSKIAESCNQMDAAGKDCVDNTGGDPAAQTSAANLSKCVSAIEATFPRIQSIQNGLRQELEAIKAAAARANRNS